jgi:hypothetical protein
MNLVRYLAGIAALLLVVIPIGAAAHAWISRLRPDWSGAMARLGEVVIGLAATVCVLELLGSVSLFRTAAVVPVLAVVGAGGWLAAGRMPRREMAGMPSVGVEHTSATTISMKRVSVLIVALVFADWATRTVDAYHHGMTSIDTLWYHLPFAARFVQDGSITQLHFFDLETVTAFYPATSELFHGLGILLMGNDVLSPALNLGWLSLALLAGWCVGRPFGVGVITLAGVAALMATPNMVATQPGGGYDDIVGLALLLASAAILINTHVGAKELRPYGIGIGALAAGLSAGTKFTLLIPALALTVGVIVVARPRRRALEGAIWVGGLALTGAFWYVRNWVAVGNPLPSVHLKLGPFSLPNPVITTPSSTMAHFILNRTDWRLFFFPGFRTAFGPVWWALLGLSAIGLVAGLVRARGSMARMLAGVGLVSAAAFVVSPQYLATFGAPVFFVDNIRYADPAIALGLVLLPLVRDLGSRRWRWWLLLAFAGIVVATQLDETIWPIHLLQQGFGAPITGVDSILGALIGLAVLVVGMLLVGSGRSKPPSIRRASKILVSALVLLVAGLGFGLQHFYLDHRYASEDLNPPFSWAQSISGSRIGVGGTFTQLQYALYGRDLSNYVQYIGVLGQYGSYAPATTCQEWRSLVNEGNYRYIVTSTGLVSNPKDVFSKPYSYTVWTGHDRHSKLVHRTIWVVHSQFGRSYVGLSVFKLSGDLNVSACTSPVFEHVKSTPA